MTEKLNKKKRIAKKKKKIKVVKYEKIALDRSERVLENKVRSLEFFFPHWHGNSLQESKQSNDVIRLDLKNCSSYCEET